MTDSPPTPLPQRRHSRGRARLTAAALLALGAAGAWAAANVGTVWVEDRSGAAVRAALAADGLDWAGASASGLILRLHGTAPDGIAHARALAAAAAHVAPGRIDDAITVPPPPEAAPPEFRLEIMRNDAGASVIGLVPTSLDRAALIGRIAGAAAGKAAPTDLLEQADHSAPPGWDAAVALAQEAAALVARGKIVVAPGTVEVTALTDGEAEKARLEDALRRATPDGVRLTMAITAPRPVIAPFALRLERAEGGARLTPCAADTDAARDRILAAARRAGAAKADCPVGLGAPSPQWADAAVAAIDAMAALPAGSVALTDTAVALDAPASVPDADFGAVRDRLAAALPAAFSLTATHETPPAADTGGPARFVATATASGISLRGAVSDERMRGALESLARARFGTVDSALTVKPDAPPGWTVRVIGALQAMTDLRQATATVTPESVSISGHTGSTTAADQLANALSQRLGEGVAYELALTYDPRLDPALDLPTGEQCVTRLNDIMAQAEIGFEPNRSVIAGDPAGTMAGLERAMQGCDEFRIEMGGHTDSQGSDGFNAELSQGRAQAVLDAMRAAGIYTGLIVTKGYGETRPVADNGTDEGREANRRIEFRLLSPYPVAQQARPASVVRGVTGAPTAGKQAGGRAGEKTAQQAAAAPTAQPVTTVPMMDRLQGPPPALSGGRSAVPAPATPAPTAPPIAPPTPTPTPDERAAARGITLRPQQIVVDGARISTPVPPPLSGQMPAPDPGMGRPTPRPAADGE